MRIAPFEPSAPGDEMISAPYSRRSWVRSAVVLSGITTRTGWPSREPIIARLIPVLPLDGSRITCPGCSAPEVSASKTMARAIRSLTDPVGFWPSSLAKSRTRACGASLWSSTIGVPPMAAMMSECAAASATGGIA